MRRSSGVRSRISCRAAALGSSSSNAVRSSGDISLRIETTCSCAMPRSSFCCASTSTSRYSKTSAASACGRIRKMITCSSSGRSRMISATSAGGISEKSSRSAVKFRSSIMLWISGNRILPTIATRPTPRPRPRGSSTAPRRAQSLRRGRCLRIRLYSIAPLGFSAKPAKLNR